jgi:DNA-directed RNA polymerase subunit RPC12/RpoP
MKCTHCGRDSKYKERKDRGLVCAGCGNQFAFEPRNKDPFTDAAFKSAIDVVSANGQVRWGVEHLYYELCRRLWRRTFPWRHFFQTSFFAAFALVVLKMWLAIPIVVPIWLMTWLLLRRYGRPSTVVLEQPEFDRLWNRWLNVHGTPEGLIVRKSQPIPARRQEPDIGDYSFDRAVICDRARTVDLLLANNFHFENNCAILSIGGYPEGPFEIVRGMLKRNPRLQVFALHDSGVAGCQLAYQLANDEQWFKGQVPVTDVGLRPRHAELFRGLWRAASATPTAVAGAGIAAGELGWLRRYVLELAAIRPEHVLKRLFRAINRQEESGDAGGGDSDGGADSFG